MQLNMLMNNLMRRQESGMKYQTLEQRQSSAFLKPTVFRMATINDGISPSKPCTNNKMMQPKWVDEANNFTVTQLIDVPHHWDEFFQPNMVNSPSNDEIAHSNVYIEKRPSRSQNKKLN